MNLLTTAITDLLWLSVIGGWILLLVIGLEADRPMSGGLPGHSVQDDSHAVHNEGALGKLGEYAAWVVFGLVILTLPVVLWWIFTVHAA